MSSKIKTIAAKEVVRSARVPKLRFPEFRGAEPWTLEAGSTLFEQINDRNPESGLPVLAVTQEHGAIPRDMIDYHVSVTEKSIETYKVVRAGDFIISLRSFQGGIEYSRYHGICSPAYVILRRRVKGSDEYFRHYLKTERFVGILTRNLEGLRDGKMISYSQFSELEIPVPKAAEQKKIAECLNSLDKLIASQEAKVGALKTYKIGLMQQLFPREDETQPRLRFSEFRNAGKWEPKTLAKACRMQAGKFVSAADIKEQNSDGLFPCYGGNGLRGFTATYTQEGTYPLVGRQGALCGNVKLASGRFHATEHAIVATPAQGVDAVWLYYALDLLNLNRFATGQAQPGLSVDVLEKVPVTIPEDECEQQRIAACLCSLDALIATEAHKLEAFKTHKKGLMQQLFPPPETVEI
ncbi:MAG: restriction endonuclease subunit S [Pseudomonadota bacterium]